MIYKVGSGITLHSIGPMYPVEIWNKQCCGKPEIKLTTVAYFVDKIDADKFAESKNTYFTKVA